MTVETSTVPRLEMAHVLFMDIVGYSRLPMDQQQSVLSHLQHAIRNTPHVVNAQARDELICLPTGDGMALVFFGDPEAPVRCAMELAQALRYPEIPVRMGVHSGPVYRIADINANRNVAGGGINLAQRVMDCGDAGHILISAAVAEVLSQLSKWKNYMHDLGEAEVKHGVRIHLFNLYSAEAGNPVPPHAVHRKAKRSLSLVAVLVAVVLVAVVTGIVWRVAAAREEKVRGAATPPSTTRPASALAVEDPNAKAPAAVRQAEKDSSQNVASRPPVGPPVKAAMKSSADSLAGVPPSQLTGRFAGQFRLAGLGEVQATLVLEEKGGVVSGCLQTAGVDLAGGPLRGVASGTHVVASVGSPSERTELQGQVIGNDFRGTYKRLRSSGSEQGSFILQRQTQGGTGKSVKDCPAN